MAAQSLAESFLRDHPELRPFLLSSARPTGTIIGSGSYGSVEEVAIPGAVCAAKKIHDFFQDPRQMPREGIEKAASEFVRECQLMSTLRHPHIVQFLGVCFLPGSRMPALVMEKLATSLHDILDPEPQPPTKPFIPYSLKRSVLHDVARGLSFLHSHSPPIIHRDLSARNVLLNEGMVAKLADLGMARIVPHLRVSTMTKAPGASIYMPPEALEDESRYDVTIDIFSLGVLAIFTLSQMFPKPLAAAYMDDSGRMVGRTELERRGNYMQEVRRQFREGHPLVQMIQRCLKNRLRERPTIQQVMGWLEEARAEVEDGEYDVLSLAQLLQSRNLHIQQQQQENRSLTENVQQQQQENRSLTENVQQQQQENRSLRENVQQQQQEVRSLRENVQQQQQENRSLRENVQQQQQENRSLRENVQQQQQEVRSLRENVQQQQQEVRSLREQNDVQKAQICSLEEQNQSLQAALKQLPKVCDIHLFYLEFDHSLSLFLQATPTVPTPKPVVSGATPLSSVRHPSLVPQCIFNPRHTCAARVTVLGLCVHCLCVCLSVCLRLFSRYGQQSGW